MRLQLDKGWFLTENVEGITNAEDNLNRSI